MLRRCPRALQDQDAARVVAGLAMLQAGVFPAAGGWQDQAAAFCDAVQFVAGERSRYLEEATSGK